VPGSRRLLGFLEGDFGDVVFLEGVGVGEDVVAVRLVGELEGLDAVVEDLEADSDAAADGDLGAGLDRTEFHLDVGGVVRGGADEALENDAELAVVAHDVLLLDTVDGE